MKRKLRQVKVGDTKTCWNCKFFHEGICLRSFKKEKDCIDFYYTLMTDEEYYELIASFKKGKYKAVQVKTK